MVFNNVNICVNYTYQSESIEINLHRAKKIMLGHPTGLMLVTAPERKRGLQSESSWKAAKPKKLQNCLTSTLLQFIFILKSRDSVRVNK